MKGQADDNKCLKITPSGEILFWLIIIFLFVSFSSMFYMSKSISDNDYHIYLQDVDGLIEGSPVRMMGVEVGYITKIKPINNEVYVKFILTNPDVYIPQGTEATVEFFGMAGSKSLELYLPDENTARDNSTPLLVATTPKRLHDAFDLLNKMYKKLNSIIYSVSSFGGKLDNDLNIELKAKGANNFNDFMDFSNKFIDDSGKKIHSINSTLEEIKHAK